MQISDTSQKITFTNKLVHQIKNLVHIVSGASNHLHDHWSEISDQERQDAVQLISDNSKYLSEAIDSLINTEKSTGIKFRLKRIDIAKTTGDLVKNMQAMSYDDKEFNISMVCNITDCTIMGDEFWYRQLIFNLLDNAKKYSNSKDVIVTIDKININDSEFCKISVEDKGIGIPKDKMENIFTPFYRSLNNVSKPKGTGLGMYICNEIIDGHGGKINVFSELNVGTTIECIIPLDKQNAK